MLKLLDTKSEVLCNEAVSLAMAKTQKLLQAFV